MREQPRWRRYLRLVGQDVDADIDDELRFHLEMRERDHRASGLDPTAAREEAMARFGDVEKVRSWLRQHDRRRETRARRIEIVSELLQDIRYGSRRLRESAGFTLAVVAILALGIGATTAIFSVLDAALLRPLPYPQPERLLAVADLQGKEEDPASFPELLDWQRGLQGTLDLAAYFPAKMTLTGGGEPETLEAVRMSADLPRLLGVVPRLGRGFAAGEDGPAAPRVVLLGEALWRRRFGADPQVVGRAISLEGQPYAVLGVVPAGGRSVLPLYLAAGRKVDLWLPLRLDVQQAPRGLHFLSVVGRLRPGVGREQAEEKAAALAHNLIATQVTEHGIRLGRLDEQVVREMRPILLSLAAAVAIVLLIACLNIANLLLA
ncbi:MAG TPA: ABC transporter permease, partial [Thermoanaerobaculia bacterium]